MILLEDILNVASDVSWKIWIFVLLSHRSWNPRQGYAPLQYPCLPFRSSLIFACRNCSGGLAVFVGVLLWKWLGERRTHAQQTASLRHPDASPAEKANREKCVGIAFPEGIVCEQDQSVHDLLIFQSPSFMNPS